MLAHFRALRRCVPCCGGSGPSTPADGPTSANSAASNRWRSRRLPLWGLPLRRRGLRLCALCAGCSRCAGAARRPWWPTRSARTIRPTRLGFLVTAVAGPACDAHLAWFGLVPDVHRKVLVQRLREPEHRASGLLVVLLVAREVERVEVLLVRARDMAEHASNAQRLCKAAHHAHQLAPLDVLGQDLQVLGCRRDKGRTASRGPP